MPVTPAFDTDAAPVGAAVVDREIERFRQMLTRRRSIVFVRLFDYLLEQSPDARSPKEIEIAMAVFDKEATFDTAQDSLVRVHVHRLRKRLDEFYAKTPGPRLVIPNGEYRIIFTEDAVEQSGEVGGLSWLEWPSGAARLSLLSVVVAVLLALPWVIALSRDTGEARSDLAGSVFWKPLVTRAQPPLMVAGDYYFFVETANQKDIKRIIMQPAIGSRKDLDSHFIGHPETFDLYYDLDIHNVPAGTVNSLWSLIPVVAGLRKGPTATPNLSVASRLSDMHLSARDVVYIGKLDALGSLSDTVFHASGFELTAGRSALVNEATGRTYKAVAAPANAVRAGAHRPYGNDYGYLASFSGPSGNRILVIAGLGDGGVTQMAALVQNEQRLEELKRKVGQTAAFEALYQVRMLGDTSVDTTLVTARAIKSDNNTGAPTARPF